MTKIIFTILAGFIMGGASFAANEPNKQGIYSGIGKRDPFKIPTGGDLRALASIAPIEKFGVEQLQLRAILRKAGKNSAMFEDPDGNTHIITEGETIGRERGTISMILDTEVVITLKTYNYLGEEALFEKVMFLPKDISTVKNMIESAAIKGLEGDLQ